MKTHSRSNLLLFAGLVALVPALPAADEPRAGKEEKKPMRVLSSPERERRGNPARDDERPEKVEKETVAFLGVETAPVSAALSAQLGLQRGTGLVVNHVVPNSAAASALQEHDILLKLDDQILIETRQLSVLIRNHKEGDDVVLTYMRGGQKSTAKVKLGKTEVPKFALFPAANGFQFAPGVPARRFEFRAPELEIDERAEVDRVLSMIQRAPQGEPMRIQIDRHGGPDVRAMALHTGNSNMVFSDDKGSLELTSKDGAKTLVAKNAKGEQLFSGPVTTPEERNAMPAGVRERLEKLEGLHEITFHTDNDFKGVEMKGVRPRGIAWPLQPVMRWSPPSTFY